MLTRRRCKITTHLSWLYTQERIYLAYVGCAGPELDKRNIPIMCCIMYVAAKSNPPEQPQFFLSSSWSVKNCPEETKLRQAVDPWRKELLATCLREVAVTGEGIPKALPAFEPWYLKELCQQFWKRFRGKGQVTKGNSLMPAIALAKVHEKNAA